MLSEICYRLDYIGPLLIKENKVTEKIWVCLFTWLVSRAIHLEIVRDMSTKIRNVSVNDHSSKT